MTTEIEIISAIEQHPTYKKILSDSFGGIMYNVANRNKYDTKNLLALWDGLSESWKDSVGGIMKGAIDFITL